jgi:hypothetical protein
MRCGGKSMPTSLNRYVFTITSIIAALFSSVALIFFFMPIRNATWLIGLITFLLMTLFYHQFFLRVKDFGQLSRSKQRITIVFTLLFSLLALFSLKGEQQYLFDNSLYTKIYIYAGTYLTVCAIVLWIILTLLKVEMKETRQNIGKWSVFIYALPPILIWTLYLIAFFPGAMTRDSMAQWDQAHTGEFNDWHPVVYTLFIMLLKQIWDSPAIVGFSQILIISLIFGYCMFQFEKAGAKKSILLFVSFVFAISPINGIYSITIWKDIFYSTFIMFFSTIVFNLVVTKGNWLRNNGNVIIFLIAALGVSFFRHNGFPVFVVMALILLIIFRQQFKRLLLVFTLTVAVHFVVTGPVFDYLEVVPSDPNEALSIPTQQLANVISKDGEITEEQAAYLNEILPLPLWKNYYNPYLTDPIKFSGEYNRKAIFPDHFSTYIRTWIDICLQNPKLVVEAFFKQTSLVWQMNQPEDGYTATFVTNVSYGNEYGITNKVIVEPITLFVKKYLTISDTILKPFIWRPANYTFLIILFTFVAFLRNDWKAWLVPFTVFLNTGTVLMALPAQDFRYLYSNTLVFYLAFLFAFIYYKKREVKHE